MIDNKYARYVSKTLSARELLEQLAEENAECAKAALKVIRASGASKNVTPKTSDEVRKDLIEEVMDVLSVLYLLDLLPDDIGKHISGYWKFRRWAERLGYSEEEGGSWM